MQTRSKIIRSRRNFAAGICLVAVVVASGCQPVRIVAGVHNGSNGGNGTDAPGASPSISESYSTYDTHPAIPRAVKAPALSAYPWAFDESGGVDAFGETMRQCVSYAAWYLNAHGTPFGYYTQGPRGTANFGDADGWASAAVQAGFKVSSRAVVGSIAQWGSYEQTTWTRAGAWYYFAAGGSGHVAVVTRTYSDGTVDVAQYNANGRLGFSQAHVRAPRYIYVPLASPRVP